MGIRKISIESIKNGSKSNKMWDQDTEQGAMVPIAHVIANGTSSNMNFLNIPQIYRDLVLVINATSSSAQSGAILFNYSSFGTYSATYTRGTGSASTSNRVTSSGAGPLLSNVSYNSTIPLSSVINIQNYSGTNTFKTYLARTSSEINGSGESQIVAGLWQKTEAISEVLISSGSGSIYWSGTATLYGIKAGI
jgi:hypothetical protein